MKVYLTYHAGDHLRTRGVAIRSAETHEIMGYVYAETIRRQAEQGRRAFLSDIIDHYEARSTHRFGRAKG